MEVRTCWTKIAKRTMRWIAAIAGLVILVLLQDAQALPRKQWKRSIDLNDVYDSKIRHHVTPDVIPTEYDLELQPFIGNDKFSGRVKINVTWNSPSNRIILHVHPSLEIINTTVKITQGSFEQREKGWPVWDVNVARIVHSVNGEPLYYISLQQMLTEGTSCEVNIKFTGNLTTNKTSGLFKNEYIDSNGDSHPFVATYLRPNHARRVFPCLDYTQYKANFRLSVLRPKNMTARSNTPLKSTTESADTPDQVWDHFEETPLMSTYQLALVVSDFESISPTKEVNEIDGRKLEIKVWGRKEYLNALKDVPDKVVSIVNYLQDYFNISILLPKLDIMAIPSYYATKASDSWGLMLFKESDLSGPSYWLTAYELLYQWIGQYITPASWSQAPSNKALNSFLASLTTVNLNPAEIDGKWPMTILYSLYYEFGKTVPFSRVAGIRYEAMSSKEELTFRMFNCTLGRNVFQTGIRNFIRQISEEPQRTFMTNQIYNSLNDVANETGNLPIGLTINFIAVPWFIRDRVPLVTVVRDYETKTITFSQKDYLREAPPETTSKVPYKWDIPLVMISENNTDMYKPCDLWLRNTVEPENLTIPDTVGGDNYIIVNPEEIGMFPVNYDSRNWKMLSEYLQGPKRETIPDLTRAKLLHDSWNLAYAGELHFGVALNMTLSLKEERSHVVWEPIFMMIDHIGRRIEGSNVYPKFEAYIRTLLKPLYKLNELMDNNEPSWKTHMRSLVKHFLCRAGYKPCVEEARKQYKKWLTDEDPDKGIPVANEFICPVYKWGSPEEWEFGLQRVINFPQNNIERKLNERTYLLKTLAGCPKDTNKIERLLNVTILEKNGNFTDADIYLIFVTLTGGATGYTTLFNFLSDHWYTIRQRFENSEHMWHGIIRSATSPFTTQEGFDMVSKLYMNHLGESDTDDYIIEEALRIIKRETEWGKKNLPVIDAWLNENLPKEELEALQMSTTTIMMTSVTAEEKKDEEL